MKPESPESPPREKRLYRVLRDRFEGAIRALVRNPWIVLLVVLALTAGALALASNLRVRASMEDLFPESTPHIVRIKAAADRLGYASQIKLILSSPDADANRRFAIALADRLRNHPDILRVECDRDISFFRRNGLLFLPMEDLEELHDKVKTRIRRAVADELGPFDEPAAGEAAPGDEDAAPGDEDDGLDEEFGGGDGKAADLDEDFGDSGSDGMDEDFGDSGDDDPGPPTDLGAADEGTFEIPSEKEIRKKYGLPRLSELYTNEAGTLVGINLFPTVSPDDVDASVVLMDSITGTIDELDMASYHPDMTFAVDGGYHRRINEMRAVQRDLKVASAAGGFLVLLLIILYFGRLRAVLFVLAPLLVGIAWTMGAAWLLVGYLNTITAFIITILFGLGVDFSIHAVSRYFEERGSGRAVEDAVVEAITHLGRPMLWAAATTSVTFLSLSVLHFRGFSQFGLIAGVGVLLCLLALVLFLPPLTVLISRIRHEKPSRIGRRVGAVPWFAANPRRAVGTLLVTLVVFGALASGAGEAGLDPDLSQVETPGDLRKRALVKRYQHEVESLSSIPILITTDTAEEAGRVYRHLRDHRADYTRLQQVHALQAFVPEDQARKAEVVHRIRELIRKKRGALKDDDAEAADRAMEFLSPEPFVAADLPGWVLEKFTDREGKLGRVLFLFADTKVTDSADIGRVLEELEVIHVDGRDYPTVASYYLGYDAFEIVDREGPIAMGIAALAVLLVLLLDLRSARRTLLAFLPLPLGIGAFLGLTVYVDWPLNIFNMVIVPTFFGIGVDTAIHLVHRGREELRLAAALNRPPNLGRAVGSVGAAAGMSSLTTAAGFFSMVLASNPGLASIGRMAPVGIFLCYLASVGVTGSLLWFWLVRKK